MQFGPEQKTRRAHCAGGLVLQLPSGLQVGPHRPRLVRNALISLDKIIKRGGHAQSLASRGAPGQCRARGSSTIRPARGVAQPGSALRSGRRGPQFESGHPDTHRAAQRSRGPGPVSACGATCAALRGLGFLSRTCISDRGGRKSASPRCGCPLLSSWLSSPAAAWRRPVRADPRGRRRRPQVDGGHEGRRRSTTRRSASRRSASR